jgi:hypothetical protein
MPAALYAASMSACGVAWAPQARSALNPKALAPNNKAVAKFNRIVPLGIESSPKFDANKAKPLI